MAELRSKAVARPPGAIATARDHAEPFAGSRVKPVRRARDRG